MRTDEIEGEKPVDTTGLGDILLQLMTGRKTRRLVR